MNKIIENYKLGRVSITLKGASNFEFCIEALWNPFISLLIKNQSIDFVQNNYDHFKDLQLAVLSYNDDIESLSSSDLHWSVVKKNVKISKIGEHEGAETRFG